MSNILCRYGDFSVPDEDDLIVNSLRKYGEWAQQEIELLDFFIQENNFIIDAGAFIGTHSRYFSQKVGANGCVYSFEPNPIVYGYLAANAKISKHQNIKTFQLALGDGITSNASIEKDDNTNLGGSKLIIEGVCNDGVEINVVPLDSLNLSKVDFIKADVEGMEFNLLQGGENLIAKNKPVIFLEVNSVQNAYPLIEWINKNSYAAYGLISPAYNEDNFNKSTENIYGNASECGLLLIHDSRLNEFSNEISSLKLPVIDCVDSLVLLLLNKAQYYKEILAITKAADLLNVNRVIPNFDDLDSLRLRDLLLESEEIVNQQQQKMNELGKAHGYAISVVEKRDEEIRTLQEKLLKITGLKWWQKLFMSKYI